MREVQLDYFNLILVLLTAIFVTLKNPTANGFAIFIFSLGVVNIFHFYNKWSWIISVIFTAVGSYLIWGV